MEPEKEFLQLSAHYKDSDFFGKHPQDFIVISCVQDPKGRTKDKESQ